MCAGFSTALSDDRQRERAGGDGTTRFGRRQNAAQASGGSLTDIGGVRVGHFTDQRRPTGCTAILFDQPAIAGIDYDGSAPAESLAAMLQPVSPRGIAGMKGGVGSVSVRLGDVVVAALVVVNSAGDIVDWRRGEIVAGARTADGRGFARSVDVLRRDLEKPSAMNASTGDGPLRATLLAVVGTNVALSKTELTKLAMMANTGAARAIDPYHTQGDGDQVIAVSSGRSNASVSLTALGAVAAETVADAIVRAVRSAKGVAGWAAVSES